MSGHTDMSCVHFVSFVTCVLALFAATGGPPALRAQGPADAAERHIAAARTAAGTAHTAVFNRTCGQLSSQAARPASQPAAARSGPPERSAWYVEPVKVFDNLYFVGQSEYSAWAVTTSAGIIIDTIYDYSVEEEVVKGLEKLGFDPATIKYVIVSHGHADRSGGAKRLQDRFGARVILSAADWDLLERSSGVRPARDMVATDGMKVTLGDTR